MKLTNCKSMYLVAVLTVFMVGFSGNTFAAPDLSLTSDGKVPGGPFDYLQRQIDDIQLIPGPQGLAGTDGLNCWDLNGNGGFDLLTEDNDGNGVPGAADCQGPQGVAGTDGADGSQGIQGEPGADGAQGIQGEPGADGALPLAGVVCSAGSFVAGFLSSGEPICSTQSPPGVIGADCGTTYVWADVPSQTAELVTGTSADSIVINAVDVRNCDLRLMDWGQWVYVRASDFSGANMAGSNLLDSDFSGSLLDGARLWGLEMSGSCGFYSSSLRNADLLGANLTSCNIWDSDLTGANFTGVIGLDTINWDNDTCPDGTSSDLSDGDGLTCLNNLVP